MELRYIVLTIVKILISVPTVVLILPLVQGAALMGGHLDNKNNSSISNYTSTYEYNYGLTGSQELGANFTYQDGQITAEAKSQQTTSTAMNDYEEESEEIPNPSPLVVPGYNLPENIFNNGKPFYLEKDPITGAIDFSTKNLHVEDDYDYVDEEPSSDIFDKANIDRKDGSLYSHKPSDVNQLTPNFHDFLNLPVKYNPEKYVYPLISSSYANTKIQGNVNKYHNHKDYSITTYKPTISPTYYTTKNYYTQPKTTTIKTTTQRSTTTPFTTTTTKTSDLMNSGMNHPSFNVFEKTTYQPKPDDVYLTSSNVNNIYLTTKSTPPKITTTKRPMSLFEQLFGGDYDDEIEPPEKAVKPPPLFSNLPSNKNKTPQATTTTIATTTLRDDEKNILTGTKMEHEAYEYEDYSNEFTAPDNIAVENKPIKSEIKPTETTTRGTTTSFATTTISTTVTIPSTTTKQTTPQTTTKPTQVIYGQTEKLMPKSTTEPTRTTFKVTSLPLGENHVSHNNRQPIIVATQNLKEQLNNEKVGMHFIHENKPILHHAPSTSNIHIPPDQNTASFVVGHHQSVEGGQYVGTDFKVSPYDHNPFRPLYGQVDNQPPLYVQVDNQPAKDDIIFKNEVGSKDSVSYTIQASAEGFKLPPSQPDVGGSSVSIQPIRNSEASLTIGVPVSGSKVVPGQVVDEKLEIENDKIEFPKPSGNKVVFPDEHEASSQIPELIPPRKTVHNKDVLNLSSKPMFHQLPSDLTPPIEKDVIPPPRRDRPRPPWDPRPGHFYTGRPEYARPPRPHVGPPNNDIYKRIDNLPNILPHFRPNIKMNAHHHYFGGGVDNKGYPRQPLLDRPSNKPIGFFEKLQPPPPPKNLHNIRKVPLELRPNLPPYEFDSKKRPPIQNLDVRANFPPVEQVEQNLQARPQFADDRISHEINKQIPDQFNFFKTPPKPIIANRRNGEDDPEIETLQMIQAKQSENKQKDSKDASSFNTNLNGKDSIEKPLYVVYPVNSPPLKLDAIDNTNKETVVIGTRAELPLPPSKIKQDSPYDQTPLLSPKNRNDSPILKPHPRPPTYPTKSDFPYPIERPDKILPDNKLPDSVDQYQKFMSSNQWNSLEDDAIARIVTGSKINAQSSNQISATLKTYTEKPIAVAYTPTEPHHKEYTDKYSMPNYGSPVIPEIRPGLVENAEVSHGGSKSEFTVSAIMHTHPQADPATQNLEFINRNKQTEINKSDLDVYTTHVPQIAQQDFQAPFQASMNLDNLSQGWTVVREKSKSSDETDVEVTTIPIATTSEFDIENFKPQLIGGFKPIYNIPDDSSRGEDASSDKEE